LIRQEGPHESYCHGFGRSSDSALSIKKLPRVHTQRSGTIESFETASSHRHTCKKIKSHHKIEIIVILRPHFLLLSPKKQARELTGTYTSAETLEMPSVTNEGGVETITSHYQL
jgi:hypothetical protein